MPASLVREPPTGNSVMHTPSLHERRAVPVPPEPPTAGLPPAPAIPELPPPAPATPAPPPPARAPPAGPFPPPQAAIPSKANANQVRIATDGTTFKIRRALRCD